MRVESDLYKALSPYIIEAALPMVVERLGRWRIRLDFSDRNGRILGFYRGKVTRWFKRAEARLENWETISLQIGLNPYALLLVFIHEWAHLLTHKAYPEAQPHGKEWKRFYKQEVQPFLRPDIFPPDVLTALTDYFKKPGAYWDDRLASACAPYGKNRKAFERIYRRAAGRGRYLPAPLTYRLAYGMVPVVKTMPAATVAAEKTPVADVAVATVGLEASVVAPVVVPVGSVRAGTLSLPARVCIQNRWARLESRKGDYLSGSWEDNAKSMRVHVWAEVGMAAENPGQPQSLDE